MIRYSVFVIRSLFSHIFIHPFICLFFSKDIFVMILTVHNSPFNISLRLFLLLSIHPFIHLFIHPIHSPFILFLVSKDIKAVNSMPLPGYAIGSDSKRLTITLTHHSGIKNTFRLDNLETFEKYVLSCPVCVGGG